MSRQTITFGITLSCVLSLAAPAVSQAQVCTSNGDCAAGLTCQVSAAPPTPTPGCLKGTTCPVVTTGAAQPTMACQPTPCAVDADCAANMVCHAQASWACTGGGGPINACPANTTCDAGAVITPPACTQTTTSTCAYKWQLPCNTDQDCGAAFLCVPAVIGQCSGGGSATTGSGSTGSGSSSPASVAIAPVLARPPAVDGGGPVTVDSGPVIVVDGGTTCTTSTSYPGFCQPKVSTCVVDADCPAPWACGANPVPLRGVGAPVSIVSDAGSPPAAEVDAGTPGPSKSCQPPGQFGSRGVGEVTNSGAGGGGPAQPPAAGGNGGASSGGGLAASEKTAASNGWGCAVAEGGPSTTGGWLSGALMLGLGLTFARAARRSRRNQRRR